MRQSAKMTHGRYLARPGCRGGLMSREQKKGLNPEGIQALCAPEAPGGKPLYARGCFSSATSVLRSQSSLKSVAARAICSRRSGFTAFDSRMVRTSL